MDVGIFNKIFDGSDEGRALLEQVNNSLGDPNFMGFLLKSVSDPQHLQNEILLRRILIVLTRAVGIQVDGFQDPNTVAPFVQFLFTFPQAARPDVLECIRRVANKYPACIPPILEKVYSFIKPDSSALDLLTAITFIHSWMHDFYSNTPELLGPFMANLPGLFEKITNSIQQDIVSYPKILSLIAKIFETIIEKQILPLNPSFDPIFSFLLGLLNGAPHTNVELTQMKIDVTILFDTLLRNVHSIWCKDENTRPYAEHFVTNIQPNIIGAIFQLQQSDPPLTLRQRIFHMFYLFLCYKIATEQLITPQFICEVLIPAAALTTNDINDFDSNPAQFISFSFEHEQLSEFYSSRFTASQFLKVLLTEYNAYDILPVLSQNTENPLEFEARVFLLERYAMHQALPDDLFEAMFNLLCADQPLFLVASLLNLVAAQEEHRDPITGIHVSEHFILNSENLVVRNAAVTLMHKCFNDADDHLEVYEHVELNYQLLFNSLIDLANSLPLDTASKVMKQLFLIGGKNFADVTIALIDSFFQLWQNAAESGIEDAEYVTMPELVESIYTVLMAIPPDSELLPGIAPNILTRLVGNISEYSDSSSVGGQIEIAAIFSRVLGPIQPLLEFTTGVMNTIDTSLQIGPLANLLCPLIVPNSPINTIVDQFIVRYLHPETDIEDLLYLLVLASMLIHADPQQYLKFVQLVSAIVSEHEDQEASWGAAYVFATVSLSPAADAAKAMITPPAIAHFIEAFQRPILTSYRDLKAVVISLLWFGKNGVPGAYETAQQLIPSLNERKALDSQFTTPALREQGYKDEDLMAILPLVAHPIDSIDETTLFPK